MYLWLEKESEVVKAVKEGKAKWCRLDGGGRKLKFEHIDQEGYMFYHSCIEKKLRVSRKRLKQKAQEIHAQMISEGCELDLFVASDGWLNRFKEWNKLALRQVTTVC